MLAVNLQLQSIGKGLVRIYGPEVKRYLAMDSNGRLRMASMAMAEVGLERGSDTTHKQNLAATHAHCTAGYSWPRDKAYESLRKSLKVGGKGHGP